MLAGFITVCTYDFYSYWNKYFIHRHKGIFDLNLIPAVKLQVMNLAKTTQ